MHDLSDKVLKFAYELQTPPHMPIHLRHILASMLLTLVSMAVFPQPTVDGMLFCPKRITGDASDMSLRSIIQLPDGRMAFITSTHLHIFNNTGTKSYALTDSRSSLIRNYKGYHHPYVSNDSLLWIKNQGRLYCFNTKCDSLTVPGSMPGKGNIDDMFVDDSGCVMTRKGNDLCYSGSRIPLPHDEGELLDVVSMQNNIYMFFEYGGIRVIDRKTGHAITSRPPSDTDIRHNTSLVRITTDGSIYQLRNGYTGGCLLHYDPYTLECDTILNTPYALNTLISSQNGTVYASCAKGIWTYDPSNGSLNYHKGIRISTGEILATEISTVYEDADGGIWLGMYNRGIFYHHPSSYVAIHIDCSMIPHSEASFIEDREGMMYLRCLNSLYHIDIGNKALHRLEGNGLHSISITESGKVNSFRNSRDEVYFLAEDRIDIFVPGHTYPHETRRTIPIYLQSITVKGETTISNNLILSHDQNLISIKLSVLDYAWCDTIYLRHTLTGPDSDNSTTILAPGQKRETDFTYANLQPGKYTLTTEVSTSKDAPYTAGSKSISFSIRPPWWTTPWAYCIYALLLVSTVTASFHIHSRVLKKRLERRHREEMLLAKIRMLIDQVKDKENDTDKEDDVTEESSGTISTESKSMDAPDRDFVAKAVEAVERNITNPSYSVSQLSSDMCMERTGLYKHLVTLLDKSPSLFIREIRLNRAAQLLQSDNSRTIADIAEQVGFNSASYFSKCFQEKFGCRPSEFNQKQD